MTPIPKHRLFAIPLDEWIASIPNELSEDAIGLWQIVPCFRNDFGLEGSELDSAVKQSVELLLANGAIPVIGNATKNDWQPWTGFSNSTESLVDQILSYIHTLGRDPDLGDIWFNRPL